MERSLQLFLRYKICSKLLYSLSCNPHPPAVPITSMVHPLWILHTKIHTDSSTLSPHYQQNRRIWASLREWKLPTCLIWQETPDLDWGRLSVARNKSNSKKPLKYHVHTWNNFTTCVFWQFCAPKLVPTLTDSADSIWWREYYIWTSTSLLVLEKIKDLENILNTTEIIQRT